MAAAPVASAAVEPADLESASAGLSSSPLTSSAPFSAVRLALRPTRPNIFPTPSGIPATVSLGLATAWAAPFAAVPSVVPTALSATSASLVSARRASASTSLSLVASRRSPSAANEP